MAFSETYLDELLNPILETLGYPLDTFEKGVCHGMTALSQNAMMMGQFAVFMERLQRMYADSQAGWFKVAKAAMDEGRLADFADKEKLLDYLSFTDALIVCQEPFQYSDFFEEYPKQRDAMDLPWLLPMRQAATTFSTLTKAMALSLNDLKAWVVLLERAFGAKKLNKVSLNLNCMEHAIHLVFDGENKQWLLLDLNTKGFCQTFQFSEESQQQLAIAIQKAFWFDEVIDDVTTISPVLVTTLFSYDCTVLMDERPSLLEAKHLLDSTPKWRELHRPTTEKLDFETDKGKCLLHLASSCDDEVLLTAAKELPNFNPNQQDADGITPLAWAVRENAEKALTFLLAQDNILTTIPSKVTADIALMMAVERNRKEAVAKLLLHPSASIQVNMDNTGTALHRAICFGYCEVAEQLVRSGLVDDVNGGDMSYLHVFCDSEHRSKAMLAIILSLPGIDVDSKSEQEQTPFWRLLLKQELDCAALLFETGRVNINSQDVNGDTLLSHVIEQHLPVVFNYLTTHYLAHLDWNIPDMNGDTAFHQLCQKQHMDVIKSVIRAGYVEPTLSNVEGKTGFDVLFEQGKYSQCLQLYKLLPPGRKPQHISAVFTVENFARFQAAYQQALSHKKSLVRRHPGNDNDGPPAKYFRA